MIFVIYGADMEEWLEHTSTSVEGKDVNKVVEKLKEDGQNILKLMASNCLIANPSKTVLMMLGNRNEGEARVEVGGKEIPQSRTTKLLEMNIDRDLKWSTHFNKLEGALDLRLFQIRRVAGLIPKKGLQTAFGHLSYGTDYDCAMK
jgi:hypothetical protein